MLCQTLRDYLPLECLVFDENDFSRAGHTESVPSIVLGSIFKSNQHILATVDQGIKPGRKISGALGAVGVLAPRSLRLLSAN